MGINDMCLSNDLFHTGYAAIENANAIEERRSKFNRNSVFGCHLSPHWPLATNANRKHCFIDFDPRSSIVDNVFDCLFGVNWLNMADSACRSPLYRLST